MSTTVPTSGGAGVGVVRIGRNRSAAAGDRSVTHGRGPRLVFAAPFIAPDVSVVGPVTRRTVQTTPWNLPAVIT